MSHLLVPRLILLLPLGALTAVLWIWSTHWYMCHMEAELQPFLLNLRSEFEAAGIPLVLEGGSLLGAVRDKGIIPTEMDIDVAIFSEDLERAARLREPLFTRHGYHLYDQRDYIFQKAFHRMYALEWEPYLNNFPCLRVYDKSKWWYADIFCYAPIQRAELWPGLEQGLPPGFSDPENADRKMLSVYPNVDDRGSVLWEDLIRPPTQIEVWGEKFLVPAQPERVLEILYGADWRIPRGKGIRIVYCSAHSWSGILAVLIVLWLFLARRIFDPHGTFSLPSHISHLLLSKKYSALSSPRASLEEGIERKTCRKCQCE